MTKQELTLLQALPLEVKILKTKARIREFISHFGQDGVYISFSGGKDSTVLLDLVRSEYPNVEAVFSNTGLEFPEVVQFAKSFDNVTMVRPKRTFKDVIENEGYPIVSKKVANMIRRLRMPEGKQENTKRLFLTGIKRDGTKGSYQSILPKKWYSLIDAPFDTSERCCDVLKKEPIKTYCKSTGKLPIVGTMADEGQTRESKYLQTGCNSFYEGKEMCRPLGFWTEQDILEYIDTFKLPIASVYGEIRKTNCGKYYTTGESRTGCVFCGFGCHLEKGENRYQRLERTHPQLHDYCINKLGFGEVLDYINVPYTTDKKGEHIEIVDGFEQISLF